MTGQSREIPTILNERLSLIQAIAAANCDYQRMNQIASGMMILDQKDEDEGIEDEARNLEREANADAMERCMERIDALEARLAALDQELANATGRNGK